MFPTNIFRVLPLPGNIPGPGATVVNKTDTIPTLKEWRRQTITLENEYMQ